jgi:two-component system NtrC family sensor kinase
MEASTSHGNSPTQDSPDDAAEARPAAHADRLAQAGRLLTGVVHEIKNPLAVIQGYAQLLHDKCQDAADRADLQSIIDETRRVGALVDDMLAFTRRASDRAEDVDLGRVVQAGIRLSRHVMRQASVAVVASLPDEPVRVRGQYGAYVQVLLNLLENARQSLAAGRSGGRGISIRFETEDAGTPGLVVANNGPPVPAELAERIFEPFVTTKPPGEGTGMGLAVCREILRQFGGSIELLPGTGDTGAAFRVRFPTG